MARNLPASGQRDTRQRDCPLRSTPLASAPHLSDTPGEALQQRLQEASELAEEERWTEAFALLLEEESTYPDDPTLLCMLGVLADAADAGGMAYDFFRRCLNQQPDDPHVLVPLGTGLARYDDPDAEGVLRLAALSAPDLASTRMHYGAYLLREGMLPEALAELRTARELEPEDAQIARELGTALFLQGEREEGLDELERAAGLAPDDPELLLVYALTCIRVRRLPEGAESAHRAALSLLHDGEAQLVSALASATQEWWDEAWDALARAEAADLPPDSAALREAEEALEAGPDEAERLLLDQIGAPLLRERLLERR